MDNGAALSTPHSMIDWFDLYHVSTYVVWKLEISTVFIRTIRKVNSLAYVKPVLITIVFLFDWICWHLCDETRTGSEKSSERTSKNTMVFLQNKQLVTPRKAKVDTLQSLIFRHYLTQL